MIFNSLPFLVFICIFIPIFYILKGKSRLFFTLVSSYFFYGWWDWRFLGLIALSTITDYIIGLNLSQESNKKKRKQLLLVSLIVNLGLLGVFKYFNFFIDSFYTLMTQLGIPASTTVFNIILPVGISFYTFQTLSYTIDIYKKEIKVEKDFLKFATYVAFFPQLVAGPIVRAAEFLPQLHDNHRRATKKDLLTGLDLVLLGFIKKVVIADSLAPIVDTAFANPNGYGSLQLIIGVIFYSFQIYCDFSGYSDIAIGLARMMGYKFPRNFNLPYISSSFSEFWNRWHISLSSWLRDYLYIPLGGNRSGLKKTYRNLILTMLLGGLWHGSNWTFVMWGALHGFYLVLQRQYDFLLRNTAFNPHKLFNKYVYKIVSVIFIYSAVCYAWIYFRSPTFDVASTYIHNILEFKQMSPNTLIFKFIIVKGSVLIFLLYLFEVISISKKPYNFIERSAYLRPTMYAISIWIISILGTFSESNFIYFQF